MGADAKKAGKVAATAENPWRRFAAWSGMADPEADARLDEEAAGGDGASRGPTWLPIVLLFALYGLAVLIYFLLGRGQALPQVAPDEYQYASLARSLADGNGLTYNGASIGVRSVLYIYAIAPAWLVTDSLTQSYAIAKAIGAVLLCTIVFPTWILARRYMPSLVALVPAALILSGSWMTSAGQMIFENLAFPLAAASLVALVFAVARPGSRAIWPALIFAGLATFARTQLAVLVPIILVALVLDALLQGRDWRDRVKAHRWGLAATTLVSAAGGIIVLADPTVLGSYIDLREESDVGRGLPLIGRQSLAFVAMSAVLPFILAVAVSLRARAWDENRLRAMLIVFWVGTVLFVVETGFLTTGFAGVDWSIQRYVEYTLPLLYVLVVAGIWQGLVAARLVALVTGVVAALLLLTPQIQNIQEQRGSFGIIRRADQLLGVSPGVAMALTAVVVGGVILLVMRSGRSTRVALLTTFVVLSGAVFAVQNQAGWDWQREQSQVWREGFPDDLSWIDNATDKDLGRLVTYFNPYRTPQTEFFNRRITRTYLTPGQRPGGAAVTGFTCEWTIGPDGTLTFAPACGPAPTAFYINDDISRPTFYDQRVVAEKPGIGRVVEVKPPPRLKAVVNPPCLAPFPTQDLTTGEIRPPVVTCAEGTQGVLYLDDPAKLVLRFRGGQEDHVVQVQGSWEQAPQLVTLPAGEATTITLRAPKGTSQWKVAFDWKGAPPAFPGLQSVKLTQGDATTELLY